MSQLQQLVRQPSDDALRAAVKPRWHAFRQWRNLSNSQRTIRLHSGTRFPLASHISCSRSASRSQRQFTILNFIRIKRFLSHRHDDYDVSRIELIVFTQMDDALRPGKLLGFVHPASPDAIAHRVRAFRAGPQGTPAIRRYGTGSVAQPAIVAHSPQK